MACSPRDRLLVVPQQLGQLFRCVGLRFWLSFSFLLLTLPRGIKESQFDKRVEMNPCMQHDGEFFRRHRTALFAGLIQTNVCNLSHRNRGAIPKKGRTNTSLLYGTTLAGFGSNVHTTQNSQPQLVFPKIYFAYNPRPVMLRNDSHPVQERSAHEVARTHVRSEGLSTMLIRQHKAHTKLTFHEISTVKQKSRVAITTEVSGDDK